jgi:hypothetical protein
MIWGFPLVLKGKSGELIEPKSVNNTHADKLDRFIRRYSVQKQRPLIPVIELAVDQRDDVVLGSQRFSRLTRAIGTSHNAAVI